MKPIQMTKEEFQKYLEKRGWNAYYKYCTKHITFEIDKKVVAIVKYNLVIKSSLYHIISRGRPKEKRNDI